MLTIVELCKNMNRTPLANAALKGGARDVILGLLSDEYVSLQTKQEEKVLVEAGMVDSERLRLEAEKILAWCKTVKEARQELSYQEKEISYAYSVSERLLASRISAAKICCGTSKPACRKSKS